MDKDTLDKIQWQMAMLNKDICILFRRVNQEIEAVKGIRIRLDELKKENARRIDDLEWRLLKKT